jgi:hypothetical protein
MKTGLFRYVTFMLAALIPGVTAAQATPGQAAAATPQVTVIESPVLEGMRDPGDFAWAQALNLSGNAGSVSFELVTADSAAASTTPENFRNLAYLEQGGYDRFPSGRYRVELQDDAGTTIHEQEITLDGGRYYTLALIGLQVPPEAAADAEAGGAEETGFMSWLRGIFGGDQERLNLTLLVLQDDLNRAQTEGTAFARVVNAAPGTEGISLAVRGEAETLTGAVNYGEAGNYTELDLATLLGVLELRLGDSQAATLSLETAELQSGTVNTIFVAGTPTEETPLQAVILSTPLLGNP